MEGSAEPTAEGQSSLSVFKTTIEEVCSFNCINYERGTKEGNDDLTQVERLEVFQLSLLKDIRFLNRFPALTELIINDQRKLVTLSGIEHCPQLEKVWAVRCGLKNIDTAFVDLKMLRELNLSDNNLVSLQGLGELPNLTKLWACGNQLTQLEPGIDAQNLPALRELWVARNYIERISSALEGMEKLEDINFSGNLIGSFQELLHLSRINSLRSLMLKDPHFGTNPVCSLSNYQTFVLCHLTQISVLDSALVAEEVKLLTEATFLKKRMYYNMRIKTLKRNTTNVINKAVECKHSVIARLNMSINVLIRQRKEVDREVEQGAVLLIDADRERALLAKRAALTACIDARLERIRLTELKCAELERNVRAVSEEAIQYLLLELDTGGNVRLVEGTEQDEWFKHAVEAFTSKVAPGAPALKVTRVLKVHNRGLLNRLETRLQQIEKYQRTYEAELEGSVAVEATSVGPAKDASVNKANGDTCTSDASGSLTNELLFFQGFNSSNHHEILNLVKEGFQRSGRSKARNPLGTPVISLQTHVGGETSAWQTQKASGKVGDSVRHHAILVRAKLPNVDAIQVAKEKIAQKSVTASARHGSGGNGAAEQPTTTEMQTLRKRSKKLRVSSQEQLQFEHINEQIWGRQSLRSKDHGQEEAACDNEASIQPADFPNYHGLVRDANWSSVGPGEARTPTEWLVLDHNLVVPEYVIEYEPMSLVSSAASSSLNPLQHLSLDVLSQFQSLVSGDSKAPRDSDQAGPTRNLSRQEASDLGPFLRPLLRFCNDLALSGGRLSEQDDDEECTRVVNMPPTLGHREKLNVINDQAFSEMWKVPVEEVAIRAPQITYLNLHGCGLRELSGIDACSGLKTLIASFNEIDAITGLGNCTRLRRLELGFNLIKRIQGMENQEDLRVLELNNNLLYKLEDFDTLQKCHPLLEDLNLRNNALCEASHYKSEVLDRFPHLKVHDGSAVTNGDRENNFCRQLTLDAEAFLLHATRCKAPANFLHLSASADLANAEEDLESKRNEDAQSIAGLADIEVLEIVHARVRAMENLYKLTSLRRLVLSSNEISRIEGLGACPLLEELSLEDNRIMKIEGLSQCAYLKKLDLGKNKLQRIGGLSNLVNLSQLSLEDNDIDSLHGIGSLPALMELYIGNNRITSLKEVQHLRELPKLIILDMLGNPISQNQSPAAVARRSEVGTDSANYRLYTVYYLKRLKVLDAVGVDAAERASAKEQYSGKLSVEFLGEKLGHQFYQHIHELDLSSCRLRNMDRGTLDKNSFTGLRELDLSRNNLTSLEGLTEIPTLQILKLDHNKISSLQSGYYGNTCNDSKPGKAPSPGGCWGLLAQKSLEVLQLGFNGITDISALSLSDAPGLKVLFLQGNEITQINGLDHCTELRELVLDKNRLRTLENVQVESLVNLRALRLEENSIRTLGYMGKLVKLHSLYLGSNRISDLSELEKLSHIPFLLELNVASNPVARKQTYRPSVIHTIATLKFVDGKEITQEERERSETLFSPETAVGPYATYGLPGVMMMHGGAYAELAASHQGQLVGTPNRSGTYEEKQSQNVQNSGADYTQIVTRKSTAPSVVSKQFRQAHFDLVGKRISSTQEIEFSCANNTSKQQMQMQPQRLPRVAGAARTQPHDSRWQVQNLNQHKQHLQQHKLQQQQHQRRHQQIMRPSPPVRTVRR